MEKTIFITGASAGLGKATAKLFQSKGWHVIAAMRNPAKETELNQLENINLVSLDVTNVSQINETIKSIIENQNVDVVFNNAGYGLGGALEYATDEQILQQIETNLTGVIRVTKAFIPYFKQKEAGLFITTTSIFGFSSCPLSSVYNATKWALEGFSESISYDLALFNVGIKTVASGGIKSNFVNAMQFAGGNEYEVLNESMGKLISNGQLFQFNEVEEIAAVVYEAATDGKDQLRYLAGTDAEQTDQQRLQEGAENFRKKLRQSLHIKSPFEMIV
ncbi:MAG: family oxidoreductase [Chryseobacterium sp.]|jgi:NAD(P)-dependent dehydrogenase (short-subunit alcohol dehydrogenase family)|uniref:SDR family NAD(P)-dependent oxidoreductase n=1 Tax=Chryseobacterium sp. TaxID=1871047 RepID=UPI00262B579D|nr:SDR family NAD(P)-dependent oxidoreductase [Chryseobacterium sp.]MDF2553996.1 family oxidoreductase [Chryseobacterium sp.]